MKTNDPRPSSSSSSSSSRTSTSVNETLTQTLGFHQKDTSMLLWLLWLPCQLCAQAWSLVISTYDRIFNYFLIRYESEEFENTTLVKVLDIVVDIYVYFEGVYHSTLYTIVNYYDSEDLWIRIYLSIVDAIVGSFHGLHYIADLLNDVVMTPFFVAVTGQTIVSNDTMTLISRCLVYCFASIPFIMARKIVLGVVASVLFLVLSPILLLIYVTTKIMSWFQKKQPKELKKKKDKVNKKYSETTSSSVVADDPSLGSLGHVDTTWTEHQHRSHGDGERNKTTTAAATAVIGALPLLSSQNDYAHLPPQQQQYGQPTNSSSYQLQQQQQQYRQVSASSGDSKPEHFAGHRA